MPDPWRSRSLVAAAGFVLAGVGVIADQAWWAVTGVGAGVVALLLMTLYFNPWLLAGIAISAGILYAGRVPSPAAGLAARPATKEATMTRYQTDTEAARR